MANITYSSKNEFDSGSCNSLSHCKLTDTTYIVFSSNTTSMLVRVATVSGESATYGTASTVYASLGSDLHVRRVSDTSFICLYTISSKIYARAGSISGTTITLGTQKAVHVSSNASSIAFTEMNGPFAVSFYYYESSAFKTAIVSMTVSSNTITVGTKYILHSNYSITALCHIDGIYGIVLYTDGTDTKAAVFYSSGTNTYSFTAKTIKTGLCGSPAIMALSTTKWVASFYDGSDSNRTKCISGARSGSTIGTVGSLYQYDTGAAGITRMSKIDSDNFVIGFNAGSTRGKNILGSVSGTVISYSDTAQFLASNAVSLDTNYHKDSIFVQSYRDSLDGNVATLVFGNFGESGTGFFNIL